MSNECDSNDSSDTTETLKENREIVSVQNEEYESGLQHDQMQSNAEVIELLGQQEEARDEESRLKRLEILNNLSPQSRRLFMIGEYEIESEGQQKYYNVSDSEAELIDPDYLLVYRLTEYATFAFSLVDLFEAGCIKVTSDNKIDSISLPIKIDNDPHDPCNTYFYHVTPEFDKQWEYDVISMQLKPLLTKKKLPSPSSPGSPPRRDVEDPENVSFHTIKETLRSQLQSYGIDNEVIGTACDIIATEETIENYQISKFDSKQILEKLVERTLEQFIE